VCHVCGREFTYRDTKVNKFLQQICDWFGDNRTLISLLVGQDITQPTQSTRAKLTRSASTDISIRGRTFFSSLTRSSSTDSIGSITEEDEDTPGVDNRDSSNGNSTRLAKLQVGLRAKPDEPPPSTPSKTRGLSILLPKGNTNKLSDSGTPKLSSSATSTNFLFRKLRSRKDSVSSGSLPIPTSIPPTTEEILFKNKSDGKLGEHQPRKESSSDTAIALIGSHKRTQSNVHSQERIAVSHKTKSKSFTTSVVIPSPNHNLRINPLSNNTPSTPSTPTTPSPTTFKTVAIWPPSTSTPTGNLTPTGSSKVLPNVVTSPNHNHHLTPTISSPSTPTSTTVAAPFTPTNVHPPSSSSPLYMAVSATTFAVYGAGAHPSTPTSSPSLSHSNILSPPSQGSHSPKLSHHIPSNAPQKFITPSLVDSPSIASIPSSINRPMDPIGINHIKFGNGPKLSSSSMIPRSAFTHPTPATKASSDNITFTPLVEENILNSSRGIRSPTPNSQNETAVSNSLFISFTSNLTLFIYILPLQGKISYSALFLFYSLFFLTKKLEFVSRENRRMSPMPLNRRVATFFVAPEQYHFYIFIIVT